MLDPERSVGLTPQAAGFLLSAWNERDRISLLELSQDPLIIDPEQTTRDNERLEVLLAVSKDTPLSAEGYAELEEVMSRCRIRQLFEGISYIAQREGLTEVQVMQEKDARTRAMFEELQSAANQSKNPS